MPITVRATIEDRSIRLRLAKLPQELQGALDRGMRKGGKELTDYIKYELLEGQLVNRRTGALQRGVYYTAGKNLVTVRVRGERSQVAEWLELGTRTIKARYFMRTGLERKRKRVADLVREEIREELKKNGRT